MAGGGAINGTCEAITTSFPLHLGTAGNLNLPRLRSRLFFCVCGERCHCYSNSSKHILTSMSMLGRWELDRSLVEVKCKMTPSLMLDVPQHESDHHIFSFHFSSLLGCEMPTAQEISSRCRRKSTPETHLPVRAAPGRFRCL